MRMQLVGMSTVREGNNKMGKPYMGLNLHLAGKTSRVEGTTVAEVYVNLLEVNNPPPFKLGSYYDIDLSDSGYLRNIELLEEAKPEKKVG